MTKEELLKQYDLLQEKYGAGELNCIYGGGLDNEPKLCFVFMNPTGKNIASAKNWHGIRYPWLGTKSVWKFFNEIGIISKELNMLIQSKKSGEWSVEFCEKVYDEISKNGIYITNLAKCTQIDARHLNDNIYKQYLELFEKELELVRPKNIILFGNQVSSIILREKIKVSDERKKERTHKGQGFDAKVYSVFYPVGNGRFNMPKAIEDLRWILKT